MRKNKMMRAASALLVAVLLTTCAISGTFAKYVTTDAFKDQARVAKWGVELQIVGNLYGDTYQNALVANDADDSIAVQASNAASATEGDDVVAPGTENRDGLSISLKGTPEVDGSIVSEIKTSSIYLNEGTYGLMVKVPDNFITSTNYDEYFAEWDGELYYTTSNAPDTYLPAELVYNASYTYYTLEDAFTLDKTYYPVIYELQGQTFFNSGTFLETDSLAQVAKEIADQLGLTAQPAVVNGVTTYSGDPVNSPVVFGSNTNLASKFMLDDLRITWSWAFENKTEGQDGLPDTEDDIDYNGADTILGLLGSRAASALNADSQVVVLDGNDYVPAVEYTHYCLNTSFDITITVSQEDGNVALTETTTVPSP